MRLLRRSAGALRRRPTLSAALIFALLALLMVSPALLPGKTLSNSDLNWFMPPWAGVRPAALHLPSNSELGDAPGQLQPFLRYAATSLPHIPLWNPYIVGGRPFLANAQSAIFSPYSVPAYIFSFWTALPLIAVLKLWVAAFGMFLLGRALGMRFGGALVAGIVYAFSLWMITWLSYPHMSVWSWIPWMLLLADRLVRRPNLLSGAGLSAVVAVQFLSGHPESSFHALLTMLAFFVMRLVQARRSAAAGELKVGRTVFAFAAATAGGAALAALTLLPFAELLLQSADLRARPGSAIDQYVPRAFALGTFLPYYWGGPTATPIKPFVLDRALYVGALPLMLAAAAVAFRPRFERICVAAFGALWLAVVFGIPPFLQIVTRLPVFSSGHNSRLIALYVLAVALLAGWGLDDLAAGRWWRRRRRLVLGISAGMIALPALWVIGGQRTTISAFGSALDVAWGFAHPPDVVLGNRGGRACVDPCVHAGNIIRLSSLIVWLTLAGASLLLIWLRFRRRLAPTAFVALAALLVCVDLFRAGMGYNPAIDRKYASQPATGAIRFLERDRLSRFVSTDEVPQNTIPMNFGLYEARGYDLPIMYRFDRIWRREVSPEFSSVAKGLLNIPLTLNQVTPRGLRVLRLLGVTNVMQPVAKPAPPFPGVSLAYAGPDARVYRIAGSLPRAFVVSSQRVVNGAQAALDGVTTPGFDGRSVAITEHRLPGIPVAQAARSAPRGAQGSAQIVSYQPERVVLRARSAGPGLLVLGDNYYPGWNATVDGRPADVAQVDYLFRGVRLGPGIHTVEFRYAPLSWRIGWIISLVSLVGLAVAVAVGWWLRRRRVAPPGPAPAEPAERRAPAGT